MQKFSIFKILEFLKNFHSQSTFLLIQYILHSHKTSKINRKEPFPGGLIPGGISPNSAQLNHFSICQGFSNFNV